jgi:hypothetical protein
MARIGLSSILDEGFVKSFQGVAQQRNGGNNLASALTGGSSSVSISTGLRLGAQAFASSVGGLNSLIGFINVAQDTMGKLGTVVDDMITTADVASRSETSFQERERLNSHYRELVGDFRDIVDNAEYADRNLLDLPELKSIFTTLGFDDQESSSVEALFNKFQLVADDQSLASEEAKGDRPIPIPPSAFKIRTPSGTKYLARSSQEYDSLFEVERVITNRPDAHRLKHDLLALKEQIDDNSAALTDAVSFIDSNIQLMRAAGFAFLDLSETIPDGTEAEIVAKRLRQEIRKAPSTALNQLENLEALVVAALTLDEDSNGQE